MAENKRKWAGQGLSNSYTMGCPPVCVDNPRALASGLSYKQVDKHGITVDTKYVSVDLAYHEIFHAKVGKGGKKSYQQFETFSQSTDITKQ